TQLQAQRSIAVVRVEPVVTWLKRQARGRADRFVAGSADLKEDLTLGLELYFLVVKLARQQHAAVNGEQLLTVQTLEDRAGSRLPPVENGLHGASKLYHRASMV